MLELKLPKGSFFFNFLEAILDLVDVASFDFSPAGLKMQTVDTESVGIIDLFVPAEDFAHYRCDEQRLSMGIPIDDMVKVIRCTDKDDTITIKADDENIGTITLSFESPKGNTAVYDMQLVDAFKRFRIPDSYLLDSNYQAFVEMPSAEFTRVCKNLSNIGGDGRILLTENVLKFFASGKRVRVNIKMQLKEATDIIATVREPVSLTLDVKYMNSFAKASTLFNQVKICLSTAQPLVVKCEIGQKGGSITYFVAPKVRHEIDEEEIKKRKRTESGGKDTGITKDKGASTEVEGSGEGIEEIKDEKGVEGAGVSEHRRR